ncbi:squalene/phytoene synthase family protein [Candidatus Pelagibacter ubique]|jgi:phytoene synthase|nr:squalene/phytoene synthase family protein [Candidatus Pelagibacter ubique]MDA7459515.1 squalene/phytoene synthase family protein [Candidatus Pelagibacter ubique]MDA7464962.1 squalene/phytoene synthase family protein [Candidatus Pelagibacter ubique]MDA8910064.1 squalene/phytoene synthase family protein [Candidatus Pelagibacter ubique]MDC1152240.1 squalene/phytoene synthase family protein [Candidatus Pelagibacter ubique]|tara:strand:- start:1315 stop:2166 length:852 start_codon:yes stop_codon:yes gene_type:complete
MSKNNYLSIYAKSFNWAGFFLPKNIYEKCSSLYDFCRTIDNIADDKNELNIKKKNLLIFKNDFINKNFDNLIIKNMWILMEENKISIKIVEDLFDGIESDLNEVVKFNKKKELLIYSYRVAGTVGLMMAKILGVQNKNSMKSAIDLGIAMQLTNISRDVIEDMNNNRFYINHDFETIKNTLSMADLFYESSFASIKEIPFRFRFAILVARRIYRKIGAKILQKENIYNYNRSGKIYVANLGKLYQTFLSILDLIKLIFINEKNHLRNKEHLLINEEIDLNERI